MITQLTLMASHPQALKHAVAEMADVKEMFGDVAMQACLTDHSAHREVYRLVGRAHTIAFWTVDEKMAQLNLAAAAETPALPPAPLWAAAADMPVGAIPAGNRGVWPAPTAGPAPHDLADSPVVHALIAAFVDAATVPQSILDSEATIRSLLSLPRAPAILMVHFANWCWPRKGLGQNDAVHVKEGRDRTCYTPARVAETMRSATEAGSL